MVLAFVAKLPPFGGCASPAYTRYRFRGMHGQADGCEEVRASPKKTPDHEEGYRVASMPEGHELEAIWTETAATTFGLFLEGGHR